MVNELEVVHEGFHYVLDYVELFQSYKAFKIRVSWRFRPRIRFDLNHARFSLLTCFLGLFGERLAARKSNFPFEIASVHIASATLQNCKDLLALFKVDILGDANPFRGFLSQRIVFDALLHYF